MANGVVYVPSVNGAFGIAFFTINAIDASTGDQLWSQTLAGVHADETPTPAVVNGMIYYSFASFGDVGEAAYGLPN